MFGKQEAVVENWTKTFLAQKWARRLVCLRLLEILTNEAIFGNELFGNNQRKFAYRMVESSRLLVVIGIRGVINLPIIGGNNITFK